MIHFLINNIIIVYFYFHFLNEKNYFINNIKNKASIFLKDISLNTNPRDKYELFAKWGENEDGDLLGYDYINYYNNYYNFDLAGNANVDKTKLN